MAYRVSSDRPLFLTANVLAVFGLLMLFSVSSFLSAARPERLPPNGFLRQLIFAAVGYVLMVALMNIDYRVWQNKRVIAFLLAGIAATLCLVMLEPEWNGAHRWIRYRGVSVQPSEFAKLVLLVFLAAFLHEREAEVNSFRRGLMPVLGVVVVVAGLIAIEPDLGQSVCVVMIAAILLFAAGLRWKYIVVAAAAGVPALYLAICLFPYRCQRLLIFLDPSRDPQRAGWQISQSLTAIGSGGLFGLGPGAGRQKLGFIPEANSDFIFAVVGEELGLIGAALVCLAFLFFFYRGIKIAMKAPDRFGYYLGLGITLMVSLQALINMSMVLALMPTKGIALPFISQGGSSLLLNFMATGMLLNISNHADHS